MLPTRTVVLIESSETSGEIETCCSVLFFWIQYGILRSEYLKRLTDKSCGIGCAPSVHIEKQ